MTLPIPGSDNLRELQVLSIVPLLSFCLSYSREKTCFSIRFDLRIIQTNQEQGMVAKTRQGKSCYESCAHEIVDSLLQ